MWAPDTASYGYDSRAASIRILSAPGVPLSATRFEVRVPGADVSHASPLILWDSLLDGYIGGDQGSSYGPIIIHNILDSASKSNSLLHKRRPSPSTRDLSSALPSIKLLAHIMDPLLHYSHLCHFPSVPPPQLIIR
jgi:glutamine synthetase